MPQFQRHSLPPLALPLLLAALSLLVAMLGNEIQNALRYDRLAIISGQWWRVFSAHVTHLGWSHLVMNLAGLALVWFLVGASLSTWRWIGVFLVCCLGVSAGLWAFNPELRWYVGLSGVLHGLLCAGCLISIRRGHSHNWPILILLWLKLIWEQVAGPLPGSATTAGGPVIVDAHFYGAISGLLISMVFTVRTQSSAGVDK
jgi:rhomboid family GlyGly-CTERM serine protease